MERMASHYRKSGGRWLGSGILRGMGVTLKNWIGSYFDPSRLVTVCYPGERLPLPENSRSFPFLIYDGDDPEAGLRCVACRICEKECPPECIHIENERDENGKPRKRPAVFDIDISVCMSCQICVEVCPFDAIEMDQIYAISTNARFEPLRLHKEQLLKPNDYFRELSPTRSAAADARLEAERAKQAKKKEAGKKG